MTHGLATNPPAATTQIALNAVLADASSTQVATFGSGCFWGTEHIFIKHYKSRGITTHVGYTGGNTSDHAYSLVCTGRTGHAEACRIEFDPSKVTYAELVEFFYRTHDPTTLNSQGADRGTQYRSAIFYSSPEQKEIAENVTSEVQEKYFTPKGKSIVTQIVEAGKWWDAEDYHQEYLFKNPDGYQCPTHRLHW
ncbi:peptide methionine sulfoxide reductase MsrA [Cantharellus anzutake]|uniref:peptide methionine sulfoxide reductase MsrA n=1 Tax=Cantharellus anzutake TaxID=1750568 RepID=UPI001906EC1F|nr:peptide methionine sulfoxide reductase MsrA [Cantharellus anzutake]KAF8325193.1 peptide methionine sulfoxide reductase MsrA [Cantharellus anzutake]